MKSRPEPKPEPSSREAVVAQLWAFLKVRLAERRAAGAAVGDPKNVHHRLPGPNGYEEEFGWPADVPAGGNTLLAAVRHGYPGAIRSSTLALSLVEDAVHDLVRQGILRPSWESAAAFYITHDGAAALDRDDADLPPGDAGRVGRLRSEFAGLAEIDLLTRHYGEAIAAYDAGLDYSATVMIGVCYEAGLISIACALAEWERAAAGGVPGLNSDHRKALKRVDAGEYVPASAVEGAVADALAGMGRSLGESEEWAKTVLRSTCHFVRSLRNSAGHPSGKSIARDDVAAHILLLPAFLRRVRAVCAAISVSRGGSP